MDGPSGAPRSRRQKATVAVVVAVALAVGVVVAAVMVLAGDDGSGRPLSGPAPTSGLPASTSTLSSAPSTSTAPTTTEAVSSNVAAAPDPDGTATPGLPGRDSEACALFRQLLALVDDPALHSAAAEVGCT